MSAHLCMTTYKCTRSNSLKLELCFVAKDCHKIPGVLSATYGFQARRLDLSYNGLRSLEGLDQFPLLEDLILDNNGLDDAASFPALRSLRTLSLNNNKFKDLSTLIPKLQRSFPRLSFLSLVGNPAPTYRLTSPEQDEEEYAMNRVLILSRLPCLRFLDSTRVRKKEKQEAKKIMSENRFSKY